jgi:hypothetical protein
LLRSSPSPPHSLTLSLACASASCALSDASLRRTSSKSRASETTVVNTWERGVCVGDGGVGGWGVQKWVAEETDSHAHRHYSGHHLEGAGH